MKSALVDTHFISMMVSMVFVGHGQDLNMGDVVSVIDLEKMQQIKKNDLAGIS